MKFIIAETIGTLFHVVHLSQSLLDGISQEFRRLQLELIKIWWLEVKGHCDLTKPFTYSLQICTLNKILRRLMMR